MCRRSLQNKEIHLLDLTALVAGTQFRGQFESRIKGLVDEVKAEGNIILFIDEVHNLVGTGDAEGSMNAANILKPALSRGEIQVIGATTFIEYRKYIEKDAALERRFQPVTVEEPSIDGGRRHASRASNSTTKQYPPRPGAGRDCAPDGVRCPSGTSPTASCRTRRSTCWTRPAPTPRCANKPDRLEYDAAACRAGCACARRRRS